LDEDGRLATCAMWVFLSGMCAWIASKSALDASSLET
jgi:hypothetical protein